MAMWTYDEPWPNSAHGSIIDYYGRAKMAYYAVKQTCAMVDVSLSYSDASTAPGQQMKVALYLENEEDQSFAALGITQVRVDYFDAHTGATVAPSFESSVLDVNASSNVKIAAFVPATIPAAAAAAAVAAVATGGGGDGGGSGVVFARASLLWANKTVLTSHDYTFALAEQRPKSAPFAPLLSAPAANFSLVALDAASCDAAGASAPCVRLQNTGVHPTQQQQQEEEGSTPCALFVKLTLQHVANSSDVPYTIFSRNHFTLRPAEAATVAIEYGASECGSGDGNDDGGGGGCEVCAEAWNSPPMCTPLP
jgi:hypothetical protein